MWDIIAFLLCVCWGVGKPEAQCTLPLNYSSQHALGAGESLVLGIGGGPGSAALQGSMAGFLPFGSVGGD